MPPARLCIVYPPRGLARFSALVGEGRARDTFLTARALDGAEAFAWGLIDRLGPAEEVPGQAGALAGGRDAGAGADVAHRFARAVPAGRARAGVLRARRAAVARRAALRLRRRARRAEPGQCAAPGGRGAGRLHGVPAGAGGAEPGRG